MPNDKLPANGGAPAEAQPQRALVFALSTPGL